MTTTNNEKRPRRTVQLRYVLTPIAILFGAIFLFIIVMSMKPAPMKKPLEVKAPLVEVQVLDRKDIRFEIKSQGSVIPRTETSLISEVSGIVVEVSDKFKVGGYFKKGEQLLAIEDIDYQVALVQAKSRLGVAEANVAEEKARAKQAEDEWRLSGKSLEEAPVLALRIPQQQKAEAELLAAKADLRAAEIKLQRTKILAPYDAMISEKTVDVGRYVSTGTKLAQTFAVDYAEVRLPIKQRDAEFVDMPRINHENSKASPVSLYHEVSGKEYRWDSSVSRYEGVVDNKSRVHYVIAQIDDPYGVQSNSKHDEIRIGTFVNAVIFGKSVEDIVQIPRSAVRGANRVFLIGGDNRLYEQEVEVLRTDSHSIYTADQFKPDMRLVLTRLSTPVVGMTLRVKGEISIEEEIAPTTEEQELASGGE